MRIVQGAAMLLVVAMATTGAMASLGAQQTPPPVNAYGAAVKEFRDRTAAYLAVHKKAAEGVPPLKETDDPSKLTSREVALGEAIRQARAGAKAGDVFGTELVPRIRDIIKKDWAKRSGPTRRGWPKTSRRARWPTSMRPIRRRWRWPRFRRRCWRPCRRCQKIWSTASSGAI